MEFKQTWLFQDVSERFGTFWDVSGRSGTFGDVLGRSGTFGDFLGRLGTSAYSIQHTAYGIRHTAYGIRHTDNIEYVLFSLQFLILQTPHSYSSDSHLGKLGLGGY